MRCSTRTLPAVALAALVLATIPVQAAIVADAPVKANDALLVVGGAIRQQPDPLRIRFDVVVEQLADDEGESPLGGRHPTPAAPPRSGLAPNLHIGDGASLGIYGGVGVLAAVPAAALLLGTAAIGLGGLALRRRQSTDRGLTPG